jgi:hypothetical protein
MIKSLLFRSIDGHDIFAVIKELKRLQKIKDLNSFMLSPQKAKD